MIDFKGQKGWLVGPAGVAEPIRINALDWQTREKPPVESHGLLGRVANPRSCDPPEKESPAAAATANGAKSFGNSQRGKYHTVRPDAQDGDTWQRLGLVIERLICRRALPIREAA